MSKVEKRVREYKATQVRASSEGGVRRLAGVIVPFNVETDLGGGVREVIRPGAIGPEAMKDVCLLWSHDPSQPLARTNGGGMRVWTDQQGMNFEAELPDTQLARDAYTLVQSDVIRGLSIGMQFARDGVERQTVAGGVRQIVHKIARVIEGSLVTFPAYEGSTPVAARARADADAAVVKAREIIAARKAAKGGPVTVTHRSPYGDDSSHSYWLDVALRKLHTPGEHLLGPVWSKDTAPGLGVFGEQRSGGVFLPNPHVAEEAKGAEERLAAYESEQRAISTTMGAGGELAPQGLPAHLSQSWVEAVRAGGNVSPLFTRFDLPEGSGRTVETPAITTGATISVPATENSSITPTSPVTAKLSSTVATITAEVQVSVQAWDMAQAPMFDAALTRELGGGIIEKLEDQLLNGTGSTNQTLGLLNVSGLTAVTYTDASPTEAELVPAIAQAWSVASTARAQRLDTLIMHPRRWAWMAGSVDSSLRPIIASEIAEADDADFTSGHVGTITPGMRAYTSSLIPTTISTNQDIIVMGRSSDWHLYTRPVKFVVAEQSDVSTGTVRFVAVLYAAAFPHRHPAAVATVGGSGMSAPSGY